MSVGVEKSIDRRTTVGELVDHSPAKLMQLLEYQSGTPGLCVIAGDDTLRELSSRFDVSVDAMVQKLRSEPS